MCSVNSIYDVNVSIYILLYSVLLFLESQLNKNRDTFGMPLQTLDTYSTQTAPPCLSICQYSDYFSNTNNFNIHCKRPQEFLGQYCVA